MLLRSSICMLLPMDIPTCHLQHICAYFLSTKSYVFPFPQRSTKKVFKTLKSSSSNVVGSVAQANYFRKVVKFDEIIFAKSWNLTKLFSRSCEIWRNYFRKVVKFDEIIFAKSWNLTDKPRSPAMHMYICMYVAGLVLRSFSSTVKSARLSGPSKSWAEKTTSKVQCDQLCWIVKLLCKYIYFTMLVVFRTTLQ
jgi:hypothetical protein